MSMARSPEEVTELVERLGRAARSKPQHALIIADLGAVLFMTRRYAAALPVLERAVELTPHAVKPARQLFYIHQEHGDPARARAVYARHLCRARDAVMEIQAATLLPPIPDSLDHMAEWRQRFADNVKALAADPPRLDDPVRGFARSLFLLAYHGRDDRAIRTDLATMYRRACPDLDFTAPHCRTRSRARDRRIRVGFVSSFFHEHTIGKLNLGFVQKLPRERFEVSVFSVPGPHDRVNALYRGYADRFVELSPDPRRARATIAEAAQDALIYPEIGMEALTYALAFARLAPVQATTWGHPETTGIATIDAFLSSPLLEPDDADGAYGERLVRLPSLPARPAAPVARRQFEREHFGLPEDARVYACPQTLFKFHPGFDPMLAEILERDPLALLVLLEGASPAWLERLKRRFVRAGIDVERRVRFLPPMPLDQYLSLCRLADVVLDTPVFGGGNSSYEALYQGAAVVTLPSELLRGRITQALYRKMGLDDLVPADARAYVDLALRVGSDSDFRDAQRARILERRSVIYDTDDSVRDLADWLEQEAGSR
jgi:predicted O-linked N-acetylglucosamine transferase (SPINDLY family)